MQLTLRSSRCYYARGISPLTFGGTCELEPNPAKQEVAPMTISAVLVRPRNLPRIGTRRTDIVRSPKVKAAIMRGLRDSQMGRVKPWSEVKQAFGL